MDYEYKDHDAKSWKIYGGWLAIRHLPKFQFESSTSPQTSVADSEDSPSSGAEFQETRMSARGTKRGRDNSRVLETELDKEKERETTREAQFKEVQKGIQEIPAAMRWQNNATIIVEALRAATDATQKLKLQEKLVAMVLEL